MLLITGFWRVWIGILGSWFSEEKYKYKHWKSLLILFKHTIVMILFFFKTKQLSFSEYCNIYLNPLSWIDWLIGVHACFAICSSSDCRCLLDELFPLTFLLLTDIFEFLFRKGGSLVFCRHFPSKLSASTLITLEKKKKETSHVNIPSKLKRTFYSLKRSWNQRLNILSCSFVYYLKNSKEILRPLLVTFRSWAIIQYKTGPLRVKLCQAFIS